MKTQTKLSIATLVVSAMMMLNVFSKPLHIPQSLQLLIVIGVFIPLAFMFHFIKQQKREKQESLVATGTSVPRRLTSGRRSGTG